MRFALQPWQLMLIILASWINRQQQQRIDYLETIHCHRCVHPAFYVHTGHVFMHLRENSRGKVQNVVTDSTDKQQGHFRNNMVRAH